jgi:hypothetical protein
MSESTEPRAKRFDLGYSLILGLVALVTCWLLALPFSTFVQRTSLNRFHFQTRSFASWAIQQPIPAMYNFYNRYEADQVSRGNSVIPASQGTLNHFPLRIVTFGDNRAFILWPESPRTIDIHTSYRGQSLHTRWKASPTTDGGFRIVSEVVP